MYKRKRLFDRGDNYRETGIPCGNPKRVHTGEVLCMPGGTAGASAASQMAESMQTQGEEQLRIMAQKQLNTKMTLQELSSQHRQFTEAGKYKPVLKEMKGVLKLQDYEGIARGDERVETLRQCGLTDDEIRLQLGREGTMQQHVSVGANRGTYGTNPDVQEDQLQSIDKKIKEKEASLAAPDTFRGRKQISRQEMDLEKSMFWGTNRENGALTGLLTEKTSTVTGDPNDPINHLPQLMADIEEKAREKFTEKRRRRRRNRKLAKKTDRPHDDDDSEEEPGGLVGCLTFEETQALKEAEKNAGEVYTRTVNAGDPESSDAKDGREQNNPCGGSKPDVNPTQLIKQVWVPVEKKDDARSVTKTNNALSASATQGDRKVLQGPVEFLPEEYIKEKRLSLEQIKDLPKFANYEAGNPSNVLYVKNLSPRVSEPDLVSMFGRFQNKAEESPIVYRLMTGRMRGQAFVTFDSIETASEAMQLVNGFLYHGKPVIVQYGRRTAT